MQARFKDGTVMICGGCAKDAEMQYVGDDNKRLCKVGVAVGKREDTTTIWVNVVAWHGLASVLSVAKKGDPVLVIGKLKSRTYNDKEYTDLVADFVSVCSVSAVADQRSVQGYQPAKRGVDVDGPPGYDFSDGDGGGELPF